MSRVDHLVIVAGGMGTRLATVHADIPKVLVPIGGKPLLGHHLELARRCGVREVTVFAGHLAEAIARFLGDGSEFGLHARVRVEETPLGTAGAVLAHLEELPENFIVLYGDVMTSADLGTIAAAHVARDADFTAMVHPNDHPLDSDLLETDAEGRVSAIHAYPHQPGSDLPNLVNAALYVVRRDALQRFSPPRKLDFVKDVMAQLLAAGGRVFAHRSCEYLKDMGTPARLAQVEADFAAGRIVSHGVKLPAVFLDRDGTLNVEKGHLRRKEDLELVAGAAAALRQLRRAGFRLVLLTNQPVIARGEATEADVAAIHRRLEWELGVGGAYLDAIYVCPHHPDAGFPGERAALKVACDCRKPGVGLFRQACADLGIDAARSWMVGDHERDVEMARRAGVRSILVGGGRSAVRPDHTAKDIVAAAELIAPRREGVAA
ncbi:MAG TPA: HAD-IIIA family hydrolase [Usitatibacter sp.]|nr:HAD-IIIA family hydrolase [Usitatibacter sp.]